jgi:DNA-directed RNA polymerase subunit RPC12/RpoP
MAEDKKYVCADCGNEQTTMLRCESCGGVRVILIVVAERHFGPNWREECFGKSSDKEGGT